MSNNDSRRNFQSQGLPPQGYSYDHGNGELSPITPSWQASEPFVQAQNVATITQNDGRIAQRYGQVTPVTSQSRSPASIADDAEQQQQQIAQSNAKSERARNAANHRHSQTKQARDLLRRSRKGSTDRAENEEEDKPRGADKQEYREKNRQAAAKCRKKKKDSTEILENTARSAVEENTRLKAMVRQLRNEFTDLRTKALAHDGTNGCGCSDIQQYNAGQAQQAARGHVGSPSMTTQDVQAMHDFQAMQSMSSMQPLGMSSRAPSFSMGVGPDMAMQHSQRARQDSKRDSVAQQAADLQLHEDGFAFDPRLGHFQEEGSKGEFL